jgi:hypothetical protein
MHSTVKRWLTPALVAGFALAGAGLAQPPGPKGPAQGPGISVEDMVERLMAFDKNKDGKVTRDELPERMHHLIEMGDTNKDGALDRDEIRALATRLAAAPGGFGGPFPKGPGPGVAGGFGGGGTKKGFGAGGAIQIGGEAVAGVVDDLKLPPQKRDQAMAAVTAHQEHVRKLMDQARAELLEKMKEILSEEELKDFQAALDRPRGVTFFSAGPGDGPKGLQKKLDLPRK